MSMRPELKQAIGRLTESFLPPPGGGKPKLDIEEHTLYRSYVRLEDGRCLAFALHLADEYDSIDWLRMLQRDNA